MFNILKTKDSFVIYFAAAVSILLSTWIAYREYVINPDAICYLQSAAVLGAGGLRKAMNLCVQAQWPFYSVLIYFFSQLTQLSLSVSAYALDAVFTVITVSSFILLVRQLGGNRRVLWLAAIVILLAHEFNSIRQYIIRDHGFLAFYLLSLLFMLRYVSTLFWGHALAWSLSLLVATLFRIEGAVFLVILPWTIWFQFSFTLWQRIKGFLQLNAIALSAGLAVFGWLIFHPEISLASLGRMQDLVFQLFHAVGMVWQRFQVSIDGFSQTVLAAESLGDASMVFILTLMMWYLLRVATNLSLLYTALLAYALKCKSLPLTRPSKLVLMGYLATNVLITSLFLAQHLFLSKRYLLALTLILMLWVPFALDSLITAWENRKVPAWFTPLVFLLITVASVSGIIDFGYSKAYMRRAGDWMAENIPLAANVYSNDYQVMYYSRHFGNDIFAKIKEYNDPNTIANDRWQDYDYVALRLSKKDLLEKTAVFQKSGLVPAQVFSNKRGDQVVIYKIVKEEL